MADQPRAGVLSRVRSFLRPELAPSRPAYGAPDFARWLNGDTTKFCGHGYHEGGEKGPLRCEGTISTAGIEAPCLCPCHASRGGGASKHRPAPTSQPPSVSRTVVFGSFGSALSEHNGPET